MSCDSSRGVDDALELVAQLLRPDRRVRPAAQLRDDEPALVADRAPGRRAGSVRSTLATAAPWTPPLCANAERPTYGW